MLESKLFNFQPNFPLTVYQYFFEGLLFLLSNSNVLPKFILKLVKPREKLFPGRPPLPPTLPKWAPDFATGRPSVELLSFLVDFGTPQKSSNRIPRLGAKCVNFVAILGTRADALSSQSCRKLTHRVCQAIAANREASCRPKGQTRGRFGS